MAATLTRVKSAKERAVPLRAILAVVAALLIAVLASAWQLQRAQQKEALQARMAQAAGLPPLVLGAVLPDPSEIAYRSVSARGEWVADRTIFLDNQMHNGAVGYRVLTPLRIGGTPVHVLVDRGWVAAPRLRADLPEVRTPGGAQQILGKAAPPRRTLTLSDRTVEGRLWQKLDLKRYQEWSGLQLHPFMLVQEHGPDDGLARSVVQPDPGIGKHYGFAAMWLALGLVACVMALIHLRRPGAE